jgi:hypothetical protein
MIRLQNLFFNLIAQSAGDPKFQGPTVPEAILEKTYRRSAWRLRIHRRLKPKVVVVLEPEVMRPTLPYMIQVYDGMVKSMRNRLRTSLSGAKWEKQSSRLSKSCHSLMRHHCPNFKPGGGRYHHPKCTGDDRFHTPINYAENYETDIFIALTYGFLAGALHWA